MRDCSSFGGGDGADRARARLELTGPKGKREVALEEFFVTPEEDVQAREHDRRRRVDHRNSRAAAARAGARSAYFKQGEKESFDWPIADVAVVLDCRGRAVRAGDRSCSARPRPYRCARVQAEAALAGKVIDEEAARAAARAAMQGATPLSENAYKVPVFEAIVRRTILAAARGEA